MKKKFIYKLNALALVIFVCLCFINSSSYKAAKNSCALFREFQNFVENSNWEAAQTMLFSEDNETGVNPTNIPIIKDGHIISLGQDITSNIIQAKPRFWPTYDSFRSGTSKVEKVILTNGYVLLNNDKITCIKIP